MDYKESLSVLGDIIREWQLGKLTLTSAYSEVLVELDMEDYFIDMEIFLLDITDILTEYENNVYDGKEAIRQIINQAL